MSQRTVNIIAVAIVGLVGLGGLAIYIHGLLNPLPKPQEPQVADFHFTAAPPAPPKQSAAVAGSPAKPAPDQLPPEKLEELQAARQQAALAKAKGAGRAAAQADKPRTYDWAKIEQALQVVRDRRGNSPEYWSDLSGSYAELADPATMHSKDFPQLLKMLDQWRVEFPDSPTPLVVMGRAYISYAWDARGSGYALTVSDVGWELYHQRIEEAYRLLDESLKLGIKDGEVYARLVDIAKALSLPDEQAREWVDAGIKADPTYYNIYEAMAENLLPRWGGAPGDIEKFAAELTEKIPGDDGLVAFGLVALRAHQYENLILEGRYDRALLGKSAAVLAERFPKASQVIHFAALCTVVGQDHDAAVRILPLVGPYNKDDHVWLWAKSVERFTKWAAAKQLPTGEANWVLGPQTDTRGIAFAPNERYLWTTEQFVTTPIKLIDLEQHRIHMRLNGPGGWLDGIRLDGRQKLVAASFARGPFQGWMVWNASNPEPAVVHPTGDALKAFAINPAVPQIAWVEGDTLRIHNLPTDDPKSEFKLPKQARRLVFSPNGRLLLACAGNRGAVYDPASGDTLAEFDDKTTQRDLKVIFSQLFSLDDDGCLWAIIKDGASRPPRKILARFSADGKSFEPVLADLPDFQVAFLSPDRSLLAITNLIGPRGEIVPVIDVWDVSTAKRLKHFDGHWSHVDEIVFSSSGKRLASIAEVPDVIKIWSLDDPPAK